MVSQQTRDIGVMTVLLQRMNSQRLPRIRMLQAKVERGEVLDNYDIAYLSHALADARAAQPMIERHPEYQPLAARVVSLYKHIIDKAIENEERR